MRRPSRQTAIYLALLAGSFIVAVTAGWTSFGAQIDNDAYDWMFRLYQPRPWQTESILLAIDEPSLNAYGGVSHLRKPLAEALERIPAVSPKTVAVDLILADNTDPGTDARLEAAMRGTRNLVLACQLLPDGSAWEDPLPSFRAHAASRSVDGIRFSPIGQSPSASSAPSIASATSSISPPSISPRPISVSTSDLIPSSSRSIV